MLVDQAGDADRGLVTLLPRPQLGQRRLDAGQHKRRRVEGGRFLQQADIVPVIASDEHVDRMGVVIGHVERREAAAHVGECAVRALEHDGRHRHELRAIRQRIPERGEREGGIALVVRQRLRDDDVGGAHMLEMLLEMRLPDHRAEGDLP
ncbi:MAG: hypothetical protein WDN49_18760 [Acetobacteraceae bacterium]